MLALFLLCHRWLEGVPDVYWGWRPDSEQDVYDSCGGRKYSPTALPGAVAPQNLVLLQVSGDVEVFTPPTAPLFEVWDSSSVSLIHYSFSNADSECYRSGRRFIPTPKTSQNLVLWSRHSCRWEVTRLFLTLKVSILDFSHSLITVPPGFCNTTRLSCLDKSTLEFAADQCEYRTSLTHLFPYPTAQDTNGAKCKLELN